MADIKEIVTHPKFREYKSLGLINEIALRNLKIKKDYRELHKNHSISETIAILSEKYFLSESAVHTILFRKRKRKPIPSQTL